MNKNIFNSVQLRAPKTNPFNLSHDVKLSFNMGQLVPINVIDCMPGDKIHISHESLIRFQPLIAPVMHRMNQTIDTYFVPYRLLWDGWQDFITNTANAGFPTLKITSDNYTKLDDYLGIPTPAGGNNETISAMYHAAYAMIYNEWYRDENLVQPVQFKLENGINDANPDLRNLRFRAWEHDYFTAALPWAQKGSPVDLPLGDVKLKETWPDLAHPSFHTEGGSYSTGNVIQNDSIGPLNPHIEVGAATGNIEAYDPQGTLEVEATTINTLRRAEQLQKWLEKAARAGSRYVELIRNFFNVFPEDSRLQRPEFIGRSTANVSISEVLNTTGTDDLPQGNMAGHGLSVGHSKNGHYYAKEHGCLISIMSVMAKPAYQQGLPKMFLKHTDPFQYAWPEFANIGEQEVQNRELFAFQGTDGDQTFGYVPRYAEYKYMPSRVAGDMRTTLNFWHLGRIFSTAPQLNQDFIQMNPAVTDRIFAVDTSTDDSLIAHTYVNCIIVRPLPKFGTPTL